MTLHRLRSAVAERQPFRTSFGDVEVERMPRPGPPELEELASVGPCDESITQVSAAEADVGHRRVVIGQRDSGGDVAGGLDDGDGSPDHGGHADVPCAVIEP